MRLDVTSKLVRESEADRLGERGHHKLYNTAVTALAVHKPAVLCLRGGAEGHVPLGGLDQD